MTDIDRKTTGDHEHVAGETPAPGPSRPGGGPPAPAPHAGEARHGDGHDGAPTQDANGVGAIQGDIDELVKVAAQRDEYLALAQRTQADFENYRKRVARDSAGAQERGVIGLAKELLPALDNLDRAIAAAEEGDPLLKGVRLVRSELAAALARAGIESFSPLGQPFDPSLHEAVATAPAGPDGASGTVTEVYQDGYRRGETILRPARVVVSA